MSKTPGRITAPIAGALIFAGLPLLGWDPTDLPGFMAHQARPASLLLAAFLALLLLWPIQDQEALMRRAFGARRKACRQRSWRIFSFTQ